MARVGIDLDGVCYDFGEACREWFERLDLTLAYADPTRWQFYEDWGLTLDEFIEHVDNGVDDGFIFREGKPHAETKFALDMLRDAGHSIHIVTDRTFGSPGMSAANTLEWLAEYELPFDSITFSADKTVVKLDYMVDDKPENYRALVAHGIPCRLLTRPWNLHVVGARRVGSLLEYAINVVERSCLKHE